MSTQPVDVDALARQAGAVASVPLSPADAIHAGIHGDDFLKTLPSGISDQVKAYAEGRREFPGSGSLRAPAVQQMMNLVAQYDPSFDQVNYGARAGTRKAFTSGKEATAVNNIKTAIGHLQELSDAADNLNNYSFTPLNTVENAVSKAVGRPNVTNFEAVRDRVVPEVVSAYRPGGGAEADIQQGLKAFDPAASPEQLNGAIGKTAELLQSKIAALQDQYEKGMGIAAQGFHVLPTEHQALVQTLINKAKGLPPVTVNMKAPDGTMRPVPATQVEFYKQKGATVVQ